MEVGGLGTPEIIVVLIVILLVTAVPMAGIVALVLLLARSKNSNAGMKKCAFCAMSIEAEARVCRFCGRELAQ